MKLNSALNKILYSAVILAIGVISPLSNVAGAATVFSPENMTSTYRAKSTQVITVKSEPQNLSSIKVEHSEFVTGSSECTLFKSSAGNSVQSQPIMNLNQPASCFRVVLGSVASAQKIFTVTQVLLAATVVVVAWPAQTIAPNKLSPTSAPVGQAVPVAVYGVVMAIMISFGIKLITRKNKLDLGVILPVQNRLLMVMRC